MDFKKGLEAKAGKMATPVKTKKNEPVKLTSNMTIVDMVHAIEPEAADPGSVRI